MSCEELQDSYELYAMGVLEDPECIELRDHLGRGCAACRSAYERALAATSSYAILAPAVDPPARLRRKVLASVGIEKSGWGWMTGWALLTASLILAILWLSVEDRRRGTELAEAQRTVAASRAEAAKIERVMQFLNEPGLRQVVFGEGAPEPPRGRVFLHAGRGVLLLAGNLPPAPAGKIYEMWVIPKSGAPKPAGLFQSDAGGRAMHFLPGPVDLVTTGAVAVTLEPEAGSQAPTTTPIIVAAL